MTPLGKRLLQYDASWKEATTVIASLRRGVSIAVIDTEELIIQTPSPLTPIACEDFHHRFARFLKLRRNLFFGPKFFPST